MKHRPVGNNKGRILCGVLGGETVKAHTAEVIIVGGGPSGSIAAAQLADKGLDVLILEKDYFPRYKPCAGGVTARALSALGFSLPETIVQEECHVFRAVMGKNVRPSRLLLTGFPRRCKWHREKRVIARCASGFYRGYCCYGFETR